MARKRTTRQRIQGLQDWKLKFLLTGEEPDRSPEVNPFEVLTFCYMTPNDDPCRWGRSEPWFKIWEQIKDAPVVRAWKKEHGTPWAERARAAHSTTC